MLIRPILLVAVAALTLAAFPAQVNAQPALPDLTLTQGFGFTFQGKDAQGNCIGKLRITVKNIGGANAGAFVVAFTIRGVPTSLPVAGLAAGASATLAPDVVIAPGTSLVRAMADATLVVVEGNESNNTFVQFGTCPSGER